MARAEAVSQMGVSLLPLHPLFPEVPSGVNSCVRCDIYHVLQRPFVQSDQP